LVSGKQERLCLAGGFPEIRKTGKIVFSGWVSGKSGKNELSPENPEKSGNPEKGGEGGFYLKK